MTLTDAQLAHINADVADWPRLTNSQRDAVATLFATNEATPPKRGRRESVSAGQQGQGLTYEAI